MRKQRKNTRKKMYILAIEVIKNNSANTGYAYPHVCPILSDLYDEHTGYFSNIPDIESLFPEFYEQRPKALRNAHFTKSWWAESPAGITSRINALKRAILLIDPNHRFK